MINRMLPRNMSLTIPPSPGMSGGRPMMVGGMGIGLEGGAGAMGPQEAVQGRSLRSYEDLDAAGAKDVKGEDLDY